MSKKKLFILFSFIGLLSCSRQNFDVVEYPFLDIDPTMDEVQLANYWFQSPELINQSVPENTVKIEQMRSFDFDRTLYWQTLYKNIQKEENRITLSLWIQSPSFLEGMISYLAPVCRLYEKNMISPYFKVVNHLLQSFNPLEFVESYTALMQRKYLFLTKKCQSHLPELGPFAQKTLAQMASREHFQLMGLNFELREATLNLAHENLVVFLDHVEQREDQNLSQDLSFFVATPSQSEKVIPEDLIEDMIQEIQKRKLPFSILLFPPRISSEALLRSFVFQFEEHLKRRELPFFETFELLQKSLSYSKEQEAPLSFQNLMQEKLPLFLGSLGELLKKELDLFSNRLKAQASEESENGEHQESGHINSSQILFLFVLENLRLVLDIEQNERWSTAQSKDQLLSLVSTLSQWVRKNLLHIDQELPEIMNINQAYWARRGVQVPSEVLKILQILFQKDIVDECQGNEVNICSLLSLRFSLLDNDKNEGSNRAKEEQIFCHSLDLYLEHLNRKTIFYNPERNLFSSSSSLGEDPKGCFHLKTSDRFTYSSTLPLRSLNFFSILAMDQNLFDFMRERFNQSHINTHLALDDVIDQTPSYTENAPPEESVKNKDRGELKEENSIKDSK